MAKVVRQRVTKGTRAKRTDSVVDRIAPLGFDDQTGIKINVYGRSGSGKTTFWSTFPSPILAVICSGGAKSGELRSLDTPENRKRISQVILTETDEVRQLVQHQRETKRFKTIVLDHATGLQDLTLKEILGLDAVPEQKSWGMARQQDWGQCGIRVKEMLRLLLNLDTNVVVVAQEREFNTEGENEILLPYVASALTPSVVGWLNPACDYIVQTFLREETIKKTIRIGKKKRTIENKTGAIQYCLRTGVSSVYTTKFRVPKGAELPDVIVDPDYEKLLGTIQKWQKKGRRET